MPTSKNAVEPMATSSKSDGSSNTNHHLAWRKISHPAGVVSLGLFWLSLSLPGPLPSSSTGAYVVIVPLIGVHIQWPWLGNSSVLQPCPGVIALAI